MTKNFRKISSALAVMGAAISLNAEATTHNHGSHGNMNSHGTPHQVQLVEKSVNAIRTLKVDEFKKPMLVPPMMEGTVKNGVREFELVIGKGTWEFIDGMPTETYGYSSPILGPVIKMNRGENNRVIFRNNLTDETTVHWHGAEVEESVDGVHHSDIQPGGTKTIEFPLNQPAATLWYHPHTMHKTASQVYKGLAGLLYLEDKISAKLPIPKTYGFDDFPVVVQEKMLDEKGQLEYMVTAMESLLGKVGGFMMVNAIISPYLEVPKGIVRLRLINGSNGNLYNYSLGGQEFHQIASDGGYLARPVAMKNLILSSGERAEILIDTTKLTEKSYLTVNRKNVLELRVKGNGKVKSIPKKLIDLPDVTPADIAKAKIERRVALTTTEEGNFLNGVLFDMGRTDFKSNIGEFEIWTVVNENTDMVMPHPFHIHGTQFRIISRNGELPPENERGWKDTFNLDPEEEVKILVKFDYPGMTMYHCHILEHEETGMMGQFLVE